MYGTTPYIKETLYIVKKNTIPQNSPKKDSSWYTFIVLRSSNFLLHIANNIVIGNFCVLLFGSFNQESNGSNHANIV